MTEEVEQYNAKFSEFNTLKNLIEKYSLNTGRAAKYRDLELFKLLQKLIMLMKNYVSWILLNAL